MKKEVKMGKFAPMYVYATEMVGNYYKKIGVKNKNVLTIVGSGDQVLNAYVLGARSVIGFDVNIRSLFITQLKIAAVQILTLKEFLVFFGQRRSNVGFRYATYQKIRPFLEPKIRLFFDGAYKKFRRNGRRLVTSEYFRQRSMFTHMKPSQINMYLKNERVYMKLKRIFSRGNTFEFIQGDLKNIFSYSKFRSNQFDIINLSNAPNYTFSSHKMPEVVEGFIVLVQKLKKILAKRGLIFFYSYAFENYSATKRDLPPLSRREAIMKMRNIKTFSLFTIRLKGYIRGMDKVVVLKKN